MSAEVPYEKLAHDLSVARSIARGVLEGMQENYVDGAAELDGAVERMTHALDEIISTGRRRAGVTP